MKLIFAIVHDEDANKVLEVLRNKEMSVTKLHSTGGFLKTGNTTLIAGVEDDSVDKFIETIRENCKVRKQIIDSSILPGSINGTYMPYPIEIPVGGATIFVMPVDRFEKV